MSSANKDYIPFCKPTTLGTELAYVQDAIGQGELCGDNRYCRLCESWIEKQYGAAKAFLMPSCTHALEEAAMLCGIQPGDEVIMPSYTFVSTANPFVLRGATIKFVDIRPDTQNLNENLIEAAITPRTKAIVPVHYAGVGCEMERIMEIAAAHHLCVIEDAAQAMHASYYDRPLGTIGHYGCFSFHATKNYTMGEGGALLLRDAGRVFDASVIRDKGTNRAAFLQGLVDKYTWVNAGSSYLPNELSAAYLYAQLLKADAINARRLHIWRRYWNQLQHLARSGMIELPSIPRGCQHNGHIFYIKARSLKERIELTAHLNQAGIAAAFHYVPLHSSPQGQKCGVFVGEDRYTTDAFQRLLRLPMYDSLTEAQVDRVCESIHTFYQKKR